MAVPTQRTNRAARRVDNVPEKLRGLWVRAIQEGFLKEAAFQRD